jgi:hypothetical protein
MNHRDNVALFFNMTSGCNDRMKASRPGFDSRPNWGFFSSPSNQDRLWSLPTEASFSRFKVDEAWSWPLTLISYLPTVELNQEHVLINYVLIITTLHDIYNTHTQNSLTLLLVLCWLFFRILNCPILLLMTIFDVILCYSWKKDSDLSLPCEVSLHTACIALCVDTR